MFSLDQKTAIPEKIQILLDQAVDNAWDEITTDTDFEELEKWIEKNNYFDLTDQADSFVINANNIADTYFNDDALREHLDLTEVKRITQKMRWDFARNQLKSCYEESLDSTHLIKIKSSIGNEVYFCATSIFYGQGGSIFSWWGAYKTPEDFFADLKNSGYFEFDQIDSIDNKYLKELWESAE